MTEQPRSSSAVRNLRSLFENKANADTDDLNNPRGRSPSSRLGVSDSNGRPLSKIRSSFIDVQHPIMDSPLPNHPVASSKRASAFEVRTESFSTNNLDKDSVSALKKEVADEQFRRQSNPDLFEADEGAMESTVNTPAVEPREDQAMGVIDHAAARLTAMELPTPTEEPEEEEKQTDSNPNGQLNGADENEPPANPDKPTTGAEEEKGSLKPAEAVNEDAVSGGQGLPPVAEDLRSNNKAVQSTPPKKEQAATTTATPKAVSDVKSSPSKRPGMSPRNSHRPEPVTTGSPSKAAEKSLKSPISERKSSSSTGRSPLSPTSASKPSVVRKTSRSSLTAPTAASANRERRASSTVKSTAPAAKRETTKPANLPSHLTAPTAASRARQEAESNKPVAGRPSASARTVPKQQISTSKPAARAPTTTRPESRSSQPAAKRPTTTAAPSESFLERMMRPTAASASKTHDKPSETKVLPQRTKSSAKSTSAPKTNGTAKPAAKAGSTSKPLHPTKSAEEKPVEQPAQAVAETEKPAEQEPEAATYTEKKIEESAPVNGKAEETEIPDIPIPATENGSATPQHVAESNEPTTAALESTSAFGQDEIR